VTLARLRAELDLLQANYLSAAGRYTALQSNPVPVATVTSRSVSSVQAASSAALKAALLAAMVGLVVSSGLAALLDDRRSGTPARAEARGAAHAAAPLPDPAPAVTLAPRSARPLKAVLPAAALGLVLSIAVATLLDYRQIVPLLVTSRIGEGGASRAERRQLHAAAQPTSPLAVLPAPQALLLNPDAVSFNHQNGPTRRTAQTIYVVNVGPAPVTIRTITITGTDRGVFAEADTCTRRTVSVYGGCTIRVRVAPMTGGGTRRATLVITANATGGPQRVPLSA
jgi:hypothetical protein